MVEVRKSERSEIGPQWRIAYAEKVRAAMGEGMRSAFDALRTISPDAKLTWLDTESIKHGAEPGGEPIGERSWNGKRESV